MDKNLWPNGSHPLDLPTWSLPASSYYRYSDDPAFLTHEYSSLPNQQTNTLPAAMGFLTHDYSSLPGFLAHEYSSQAQPYQLTNTLPATHEYSSLPNQQTNTLPAAMGFLTHDHSSLPGFLTHEYSSLPSFLAQEYSSLPYQQTNTLAAIHEYSSLPYQQTNTLPATHEYSSLPGFLTHDYCSLPGFLTGEHSSLPNQQSNTLPAFPYTTPQLSFNVGESSQDILHIEEDSFFGHSGYQSLSSESMGTVQCATTSSSSSRRPYKYFRAEDVKQLIDGVYHHGKCWRKIIELPYFKDSGRKKEHLMEKWKDMMATADRQKDPELRDLYSMAKEVNAFRSKKGKKRK